MALRPDPRARLMLLTVALLACVVAAVALTEESAPAASSTVLPCNAGPAANSGWMAAAGGAGVCVFDDATNLVLQDANLRSARDVAGAWPAAATLGGTAGNLFTLTAWMMMGQNAALSPGLNLSGAATPLFVAPVTSGGLATLRALHGAGNYDQSLGSLPITALAPYRWIHIGASCRLHSSGSGCNFLFSLNGEPYNSSATGTRYAGPFTYNAARWGAVDTGGSEKRLQGGVAEVKLWSAQASPLNEGQLLYLARRPPAVLQGVPPVLAGLPSVMHYCQSAPLTIDVYCPFDLSVFGLSSATLTVSASNGVVIAGNGPVLLFNAANAWKSTFTLATNWAWGVAFTLSFVSSEPGYMGAPATQTIWLNSASVVRAAASIDSRFSAATAGVTWTAPGPSGVSGTVVFPNPGASLTWSAANLGTGAAFPSLWSGLHGWSAAFWTRFGSSGNNIRLFDNYNAGSSEGVLVQLQMGPNQIRVISTVAGSDTTNFFSYTLALATWYHIVIVGEKEGTASVYVNGVAISFLLAGVTRTSYPMQLPSLVTRVTPTTSSFKDGEFAAVSFWERALSADAVATLFATKPEAITAFGVSAITVRQYTQSFDSVTEQISQVDAGLGTFSPVFQSGSGASVYAINVPWSVFAVRVTATIGAGTATLDAGCSDSVAMATTVPSSYRWFSDGTAATTMQLHVVSSIEGAYTLQITRAAPDVGAITIGGWKAATSLGAISATPPYVPGSNALAFNVSLPGQATLIRVTVEFTTGSSVSLVLDGVTFQSGLVSGAESNDITILASKMLLQVVSTVDGTRSFILHPSTAATRDVEFEFTSSGGGPSSTAFVLSPLLSNPGAYSITVPYRWDSFAFAATYLSGSITYDFASGGALAAPATGVFVTPAIALPTATTYSLLLLSSVDGLFTISVVRSLQSLTAISLRCDDAVSTNQLVVGPTLTADQFALSMDLGARWTSCAFVVTYTHAASVALTSPSVTAEALVSGVASTAHTMPSVADLVLTIDSSDDGVYTLTIHCLAFSVSVVAIEAGMGDAGSAGLTSVSYSGGPFTGGQLTGYAATVGYRFTGAHFAAVFASGAVTVETADPAETHALTSGATAWGSIVRLAEGLNTIHIRSVNDGVYAFALTRSASTLTSIVLLGFDALGAAVAPTALWTAHNGSFVAGSYSYLHTVPHSVARLSLRVVFGSGTVDCTFNSDAPEALSSPSADSTPVTLSEGSANVFTVDSSLDGVYRLQIIRLAPQVSAVVISAPTALTLTPAFVVGSALVWHAVSVAYKRDAVSVQSTFDSAGTLDWSLNGAAQTALSSAVASGSIPMLLGSNLIVLASAWDGEYRFNVSRRNADMAAPSLLGVSSGSNVASIVLSPSAPAVFASSDRLYQYAELPFVISSVVFTVPFGLPSSVTLQHLDLSSETLVTATPSAPRSLSVGINLVELQSSEDGAYVFNITRRSADLSITSLQAYLDESGSSVLSSVLASLVSLPNQAGVLSVQSLNVSFKVQSLKLTASFLYAGTVQLGLMDATVEPLTSAAPSSAIVLAVGQNLLWVNSTRDGPRLIHITRAAPDVSALTLTGQTLFVPSTSPSLLPSPAFVATNHSYSLVVPFVNAQMAFALTFGTAGTVSMNQDGGSATTLASGVASPLWSLTAGVTHVFHITSSLDGVIVVSVRRSSADFSALSLWPQDVNGFFPPTPIVLVPAFQPGVFAYTATVAYMIDRLAVQAAFADGPLSLTRIGVTSALSAGVKTAYEPLDVLPLTNVYTITSPLDGTYTLTLLRLPFNPCAAAVPLCANNGVCGALPIGSQPAYACNCTYGFSDYNCTTCSLGAACGGLPVGVLEPEAHLTALPQSTVGPCDLLTLDGSGSIGFGTSAPLYRWQIESVTLQDGSIFLANLSTPLNPLSPFNETLGVSLGSFPPSGAQHSIILPAYLLIDNATYSIALSVGVLSTYDYTPIYSSTARVTVTKRASAVVAWMPQPLISVPALVVRSSTAQFAVSVQQSTCAPLPGDAVHSFAWSVAPTLGGAPVFTYNRIPLIIPADTLLAGTAYSVQLTLTTSSVSAGSALGSRRLLATASGTTVVTVPISVSVQPLQASILYGLRQKTVNADFTIDGSMSKDPDWAGAAPPPHPITFAWTASWVPQPNPTNVAPTAWPLASPIVTTDSSIFVPRFTFASIVGSSPRVTFRLSIASLYDSRVDSTTVDVDVMPQFPELPSVSLLAPVSRNPSQSLTIQGKVFYNSSAPTATRSDLLSFLWTSVSHPSLDLQSSLIVSSDINGPNLIVRPNMLPPGYHTFRLLATDPAFVASATPVSSYGEGTIYINAPPYAGSCALSPTTGEALSTLFSISCSGWIDPQGYEPLQYEFAYFDTVADPLLTNAKLLKSAISSASYSSKLPAGELAVRVSVIDTAGAVGTYLMSLNVTVPQLALSDPAAYVANMSANLAALIGQQDSDSAFLFITELADVLNTVPSTDGSAAATDQLRQDLLTSLAAVAGTGSNSTMSTATLQLVSQALGSLTSDPAGLNNTQTWQLAQNVLSDAISNIAASGDDVSAIVSNLAASTSNMLVDCAYLDSVSDITQTLLSAALNGQVTGSGSSLNTTNLQASATRDTIAGGANITLANGVTVHLSAEALAQYASLGTVSAADAETIAAQNALALDTRIVTFDERWAVCRSAGTSGIVSSALTTIDITLSNGQIVDISQLLAPIGFDIPFNLSASGLEPPRCPGDEEGNLDALARALVCSYWSPANKSYSSAGCRNEGFNAARTAVHCSCGHLTEFAIIYRAELQALGCIGGDSALGQMYYLAFFVLYGSVGFIAALQLSRVLASSGCKHWLMAVEHALVLSVAVFRAWNMLNYYVLYEFIPLKWITIISGVPHLFTSWIFTFVIFAWAAIYHTSVAGRREDNPFRAYQNKFIAGNSAVSATLFALFALMSQAHIEQQEVLYEVGVTLIAVVSILFAVFFILYGLLLVRTLTKDFASPYARKLFTVAVGFSTCFFASSAILLISVGAPEYYNARLMTFNCVYFSLDLIVLLIVMGLFRKSVSDSVHANRVTKSEESTGTGTPNSSKGSSGGGRAGTGSKSDQKMLQKSRNTVLTKKGVSVHVGSAYRATTPEQQGATPGSDDDTDHGHWTVSPRPVTNHRLAVPGSPNLSGRETSPHGSEPGSPADARTRGSLSLSPAASKYVRKKKLSVHSPNFAPSMSPGSSPHLSTPDLSPPSTPLVGCAQIPSSVPGRGGRVAIVGPRRISATSVLPSTSTSAFESTSPPISPRNRLATKYTSLRTSTAAKAPAGGAGVSGVVEDCAPMSSPPVGSAWSVTLEPLASAVPAGAAAAAAPPGFLHFRVASSSDSFTSETASYPAHSYPGSPSQMAVPDTPLTVAAVGADLPNSMPPSEAASAVCSPGPLDDFTIGPSWNLLPALHGSASDGAGGQMCRVSSPSAGWASPSQTPHAAGVIGGGARIFPSSTPPRSRRVSITEAAAAAASAAASAAAASPSDGNGARSDSSPEGTAPSTPLSPPSSRPRGRSFLGVRSPPSRGRHRSPFGPQAVATASSRTTVALSAAVLMVERGMAEIITDEDDGSADNNTSDAASPAVSAEDSPMADAGAEAAASHVSAAASPSASPPPPAATAAAAVVSVSLESPDPAPPSSSAVEDSAPMADLDLLDH